MYLYKKQSSIQFDNFKVYYNNRHLKIWNLLDSLGSKRIHESIKIYKKLSLGGFSLVPILISLTTLYSELLMNNTDRQNQYNGLNKIINKKMSTYNQNYSRNEIMKIIVKLRDLDILLKSTGIKENLLFIPFMYKICGNYYDK